MPDIKDWSTTAASNIESLTGLDFDEGMLPSDVNNSIRAMMAQIAAMVADAYAGLCAYYAGAGTANAHTITVDPAITSYVSGQRFVVKWGATNTSAATLNCNSLGAKNIYYAGAALTGGEIVSGRIGIVVYDGTQFELLTPFVTFVQDTTNKHLGIGSGVFAAGTGGTTYPNMGIGQGALAALTTGYGHVAIGVDAGKSLTSSQTSTAVGYRALDAASTTSQNSAFGFDALGATTGAENTGLGTRAGDTITTGSDNVCVGYDSDTAANNTTRATAIGTAAVAGSSGIAIGAAASAAANCISIASASYTLTLDATARTHSTYLPIKVNGVQYYISLQT